MRSRKRLRGTAGAWFKWNAYHTLSAMPRKRKAPKPTVTFRLRYALAQVTDPDMAWLRDVIHHPRRPGREFGEAGITFDGGGVRAILTLIHDRTLGYYIVFGPLEWLSLGDRGRLAEVVCPDDWEASAGLFVPPEQAWKVIRTFCESGTRSDAIEWIRPTDIPEGGNC